GDADHRLPDGLRQTDHADDRPDERQGGQTQNERPLRLELTIHDIPLLVNFIRWGSLPPGFPISPAPTRGPASFDVCPFLRGPRRAASPGLPAAAPSLRMVAGGFPDMKRGCHAFIAQMERHPGGGMV